MPTKRKINFKKYLVLTTIIMLLSIPLLNSSMEFLAVVVVMFAASLNQWMLVNSVIELTENAATGEEIDKANVFLMLVGKAILLISALSFGVHIMGNRIIIPVLIYILQIVVLYFSLEK